MTKLTPDAKHAVQLAMEGLGGVAGLIKWAKSSTNARTLFYTQLFSKLIPLNVSAQVDVNVNADEALQKLQTAFQSLVDANEIKTIEAVVNHDTELSAPAPDLRPKPDVTPPPIDLTAEVRARATRSPIMNTAAAEMTTTERYFEWARNGGDGFWANLPGRIIR